MLSLVRFEDVSRVDFNHPALLFNALCEFRAKTLLTTQAQPVDDFMVLINIFALEVIKQASALRDHLKQPAPRVVIFLVCFEMLGQFADALTQECDLHLG